MNQKTVKSYQRKKTLESIGIVILAFYPLRHIFWGLDLWDTGYNYANFQYMGTEHMDSMWLFSTYLSNLTGHLITKLPNAGTLAGMNFYTGLFVSLLALLGYWFCTKILEIPKWIAFAGELTAISLCWCPTALLYNYLTYVLFLAACILLYQGLVRERSAYLVAAGICLGANVLVRFPNLPEAAMIVAVWSYDFIAVREENRGKTAQQPGGLDVRRRAVASVGLQGFWKRTLRHTGWCLLGYVGALLVLFGWIAVRYGMENYVAGITRLFSMTDNATDYKATSMLMGIVGTYVENLYWFLRIGVIVVGGILLFIPAKLEDKKTRVSLCALYCAASEVLLFLLYRKQEASARTGMLFLAAAVFLALLFAGIAFLEEEKRCLLNRVVWCGVSVAMVLWLYLRKFCSFHFYSYDSMLRPGILFLMLTMLLAAVRIFHPKSPKEERLLGGMLILVILLTSIGSNNGVYPSLNNLFVAAPYTLWEVWRFARKVDERKISHVILCAFPVKTVLLAFLLLCAVQFGGFGARFVFAEATGVRDASASVENNEILKNIKMSQDKAQAMRELSAYVEENGLKGQEVILYGGIPSLSYYLQMPSAFNPWSDLRSYSAEVMAQELERLEKEGETPVIILENTYCLYLEGGEKVLVESGVTERKQQEILSDEKWELLIGFMEENGYEQTFRNEKFAVYRP